jgi:regulation of enolase protein 1 (concanavalin A-like superfamily)
MPSPLPRWDRRWDRVTALPEPWADTDVGSPSPIGSASYDSSTGTYTLTGGGSDIWGTSDQFNYDYQNLSGDGTIIAEVTGLEDTNNNAKAGLMIRASLAADSAYAMADLTPSGSVEFSRRASTGSGASVSAAYGSAPIWLKLTRSGDTFSAYESTDGTSWTLIGSDTIAMQADVLIGLAVCSHDNGTSTTATFTNVSRTAASAGRELTAGLQHDRI